MSGLSPQDSQTGEDVVGGIHYGVLHLDRKIEQKIHFQAELHQQSQEFEVFTCQTMLSCPHEDDALSSSQPPRMTNPSTLHILEFRWKFSCLDCFHKLVTSFLISAHVFHYIPREADQIFTTRNPPKLRIEWHLAHTREILGRQGGAHHQSGARC